MRAMWSHHPAGRPVTGITSEPRLAQALEGRVGHRVQPAVRRERVVDVGEDAANRAARLEGEFGEWLHGRQDPVSQAA